VGQNSTQSDFNDSELVIALVGPVGTDFGQVTDLLSSQLRQYQYKVETIRISEAIIRTLADVKSHQSDYERIVNLMDAGDETRKKAGDNSILAKGVAAYIASKRPRENGESQLNPRTAYIISSLKHPAEVSRLQQIYPHGFYLFGINSSAVKRKASLKNRKGMSDDQADALMRRDEHDDREGGRNGQQTTDTFHLADFFLNLDESESSIAASIERNLKLLFGHPYTTPLFDEFAMFMAFAASLRSADLSRQVGAVVARREEILSLGANDCPKFGGGLYWPERLGDGSVVDAERGRDYMRGIDANKEQQAKIIENICKAAKQSDPGLDDDQLRKVLADSPIDDLIEFGRVVHAEMEALLSCSRRGVSTQDSELLCTTFPCHNCAKHIVAAGVKRVVYIEPYAKSKAFELHDDAKKQSCLNRLSASVPGDSLTCSP
jgi:deoxycytidylate deaminase